MTAQNFPLGYPHAHGTSAEAPSTAADVLREHQANGYSLDPEAETVEYCTCGLSGKDHYQHQADMLAAAGLLATAEPFPCCRHCAEDTIHEVEPNQHDAECQRCTTQHDREVAAQALRDWIEEWPTATGDGTFLQSVARQGRARAERIAAGG